MRHGLLWALTPTLSRFRERGAAVPSPVPTGEGQGGGGRVARLFRLGRLIGLIVALGAVAELLVGCRAASADPAAKPHLAAHTLRADDYSLALARAAGFDTIVQVFAWREIEPTRDQFHWEVTDQVVAAAEYYGLDLVVRLDQHPAWASAVQPPLNAPPDHLGDYRHFVERVAMRYRGRIRAYIIWNEPNLALEWGGRPPDPAAYVELLRTGYEAVKAGDPAALVVSAGLAPTNGDGELAMDERAYLRAMYRAGAARYFDVLGAHPYGLGQPPDAPLTANGGLVFGRLVELRAIMLDNGDGDKPVWITEVGWTVDPPPDQPGTGVSLDQQAAYLTGALERVRREWPWVGLMTVWNLAPATPGDPFGGYSLLDAAGQPRPAYRAWQRVAVAGDQSRREAEEGERSGARTQPDRVPVLAEDVVIHLGDSDVPAPEWPLYGGRNPSQAWTGGFYLVDPGRSDWTLWIELEQQAEVGVRVTVNGTALAPDLPVADYARRWLSARRRVPVGLLRPGYNELAVTGVRLAPDLQHKNYTWNDFEFRAIRLVRESSPR
jgi:hypothetical protein